MSINNPFEGEEHVLSQERVEKLEEISARIQQISGIRLEEEFTCHINLHARNAGVIDMRRIGQGAQIDVPENPSLVEVAHELAHLIIDPEFSHIKDERVISAILEGINDLVAAEAVYIPRAHLRDLQKSLYQSTLDDFSESEQKVIVSTFLQNNEAQAWAFGRDVDHVVGRTFVEQLITLMPKVQTSKLIACLQQFPPTREQMTKPETYYVQQLLSFQYEEFQVENVVMPVFTDEITRII